MNIGDLKKLIEYLKDDTELVLMQFGNGNKKDCMLLIDDFGIAGVPEENANILNRRCRTSEIKTAIIGIKTKHIYSQNTNLNKIRAMSNDDLAESRIDRIDIYCKSDTQMWTGDFSGIAESKEEALRLEKEWLESECDAE